MHNILLHAIVAQNFERVRQEKEDTDLITAPKPGQICQKFLLLYLFTKYPFSLGRVILCKFVISATFYNNELQVSSRLHNCSPKFTIITIITIRTRRNFPPKCLFFLLHRTLTSNLKFEACLKKNRSRLDEKANDCGMIVFLCELASSLIELA